MDRHDLEPGGGLRSAFAGLHQLLCHAHGGASRCYGRRQISRPYAPERRPVEMDRHCSPRSGIAGNSPSLEETAMVFVNSMSDLFHERVPDAFVAQVWDVMAKASKHTFQILTKRPDRMAHLTKILPLLKNVWLGTSVESGDYLGRLDDLRHVRAQVRFVSFEPLLGSVGLADLSGIHW